MKLEYLMHTLQHLEKELGKGVQKYSTAQVEIIRNAILKEGEKSLEGAFDFIIMNFNNLPTPQKLIEAVRIEASKHRQSSWDKEKAELNKPLQPRTEFAKECMKITMKFFPGENEIGFKIPVDYQEILDDAQVMAIKYPGSDWSNIYQDWKDQWTKEGKLEPRQSSLI